MKLFFRILTLPFWGPVVLIIWAGLVLAVFIMWLATNKTWPESWREIRGV